ncbi:hypothetical protein IJ732_06595 [bacterium]|nr:hypothetical protein [bacterium]
MKVLAYLHTHWDREWYREFEIFRLRLLRVFDNVLEMLENNKIPSFYFDGQTSALEDYLQIRPEKEFLVRKLISQKKLFIGPFYTLVDEFLTDEDCFRKNLEIGLEYSRKMGCEDFIGYFADTFGHSQAVPLILKEFGIDKSIVWRGVPEELPSEFVFNDVNTVNLVRGYFNDIFATELSLEKKAEFLQGHIDKIAKKSKNLILMPVGADHLGVSTDIAEQIKRVNKLLNGYEIELSNPFEYFKNVTFEKVYDNELRDNSQTFILQGCYSARADVKRWSAKASRKLFLAEKISKQYSKNYDEVIKYAYKLLLQNLAHDGICGCSTDEVHSENITRYKKVLQIAETIIKEITLKFDKNEISDENFCGVLYVNSDKKGEVVSVKKSVDDKLFYDTLKIPVTEDFRPIYTNVVAVGLPKETDLKITETKIENSKISLEVKNNQIIVTDKVKNQTYDDFMTLVDFKDLGDTYNFAPDVNDLGNEAEIVSSKILRRGKIQAVLFLKLRLKNENFKVEVSLNKFSHLLKFRFDWINRHKNHLLQARFNLKDDVSKTCAQSMGYLFERDFDPDYNIRENLPKTRGLEAKTNTAPFQKYLWSQGIEFISDGVFEYEVFKKSLSLTLLRSIGIISNPKNPARTTPAGPPIDVPSAQLLGQNTAEFWVGFADKIMRKKSLDEVFPTVVVKNQQL